MSPLTRSSESADPFVETRRYLRETGEPPEACARCPRLGDWLKTQRDENPDWWNRPVPTWAAAPVVRLLIVGLAPGLKGANRTGVPFKGDASGDLLFATLETFGFAAPNAGENGAQLTRLHGTAITNAVRCLPPQNRPTGPEITNCRPYLQSSIERFGDLRVIVTLGVAAHQTTLRALGIAQRDAPFGHGHGHDCKNAQAKPLTILSSYHCSRYNVNTKRLTPEMFNAVFKTARQILDEGV